MAASAWLLEDELVEGLVYFLANGEITGIISEKPHRLPLYFANATHNASLP